MIPFKPAHIYIEQLIRFHPLVKKFLLLYPRTPRTYIQRLSDLLPFISPHSLILAKQKGACIVPCPGTPQYLCCNYYIIDIGCGCLYNCSYCFLRQYKNTQGIILYVNIDDTIKKLLQDIKNNQPPYKRIGTGEFTDSFLLDPITEYSIKLIKFFADKNLILELKTKGLHIEHILNLPHNGKTVIAWSLNPEKIIKQEEPGSASLNQRLSAAVRCQDAGYPLAFHFDPIIYNSEWESDYKKVIEKLKNTIDPNRIVWISLGTLRFNPGLKFIMQKYYPQSKIIYEEMIPGLDGKLRYLQPIRIAIYKTMFAWLKEYCPQTPIYLCMESTVVWQQSFGWAPKNPQELESYIIRRWENLQLKSSDTYAVTTNHEF